MAPERLMRPEAPADWHARMKPAAAAEWPAGAALHCFDDTDPAIEQPALDENVVAIHLRGPKRVTRWQGERRQTWDVPVNAITFMPAYRANRWRTEGPIAFAHLTLGAGLLAKLAREDLGREPRDLLLLDQVGVADPLVAELMLALIGEASAAGNRRLYRESLLTALGVTVLRRYSTLAPGAGERPDRGGLAGWQLRRVTGFMADNLARDVSVDELVALTGLSRAQFFRAFRQSTGETPAAHLQRLRIRHAETLLADGRGCGEVAALLGYGNHTRFAFAFARVTGKSPGEWRRAKRAMVAG